MATVYGVNRTHANTASSSGSHITDPGTLKGKVMSMQDSYEASAVAIGTVIEMGIELPKGARIVEVTLITDALGAGAKCQVGDYEDNNRYITATTCNTANLVTRMNAIDGRFYEVDETYTGKTEGSGTDRQIFVKTSGGTATGTIKLLVEYVYAN